MSERTEVADLYNDLNSFMTEDSNYGAEDEVITARINRKFRRQVVERFRKHGIIIPEKATLLYRY